MPEPAVAFHAVDTPVSVDPLRGTPYWAIMPLGTGGTGEVDCDR